MALKRACLWLMLTKAAIVVVSVDTDAIAKVVATVIVVAVRGFFVVIVVNTALS